ncbi:MAG: hypothetical protein ABIR47_14400 [Candidatus Kapaibacterium sp.]
MRRDQERVERLERVQKRINDILTEERAMFVISGQFHGTNCQTAIEVHLLD